MPIEPSPEWHPDQYLRFSEERLRPAMDLLARVPLEQPRRIYDLGCGTGTQTRLMAKRWPDAAITGIDGSKNMLARAEADTDPHARIRWIEADLNGWAPPTPADLIFSNAALHWLDDHATLFPRLMQRLAPGGCLAVQMPDNFDQPSHTALWSVARDGPWATRLADLVRTHPVARASDYHAWLSGESSSIRLWQTTYYHVLEGLDPVVAWMRGSILNGFLDRLQGAERDLFLAAYADKSRKAYPADDQGRTVFPFSRLFLVALR